MGAGITGLSIALELLSRGRRVTVCEAEVVGSGTTGGSSGHLDAHPEQGPAAFLNQLGETQARACTRLRLEAIRTIGRVAGGECDFQSIPAFRYSENDGDRSELRREFAAAEKLGLNVEWVESVPFPRAASGYCLSGMARIDCMRYLRRLCDAVVEQGGEVFERSPVRFPVGEHPRSADVGQGRIRFDHFISAVHCHGGRSLSVDAQIPPYQSYVLAVSVRQPPADALFWDNSNPYYYVRRSGTEDERLLLVGGCDHRTGAGDEQAALRKLEQWTRDRFDVEEVVARWSAELFEPVDRLPLIGRAGGRDNVWVATGLSGIGLTWGTAAAQIIADLLDNTFVEAADALSPGRLGLSGIFRFAAEQVTSAANLARRVLPARSVSPDALAPGEGAVGMLNGQHVAVCRDLSGCLHVRRPLCTHMGGVVQWNAVEQTWDCPVHGGRFAANGERMYGPPQADLAAAEVQQKQTTAAET